MKIKDYKDGRLHEKASLLNYSSIAKRFNHHLIPMKYSRFEDLPIWQEARQLTKKVYDVTREGDFSKDFRLKAQICDSSVSAMSNIAEGFENQTTKQFIRYLYIAKGSSGEFRSQLYVALDAGYIQEQVMLDLKQRAESISKQISKLIGYLEDYSSGNVVRQHEELGMIIWKFYMDIEN